jgi:hypothetical protein
MKYTLFVVSLFTCLLISCFREDFKIIIENKSNETLNSLILNVQGKEFKVEKIEPGKSYTITIPFNSIELNGHDFSIESSVILKDGKSNRGLFYNDLSGTPNSVYQVQVYQTHTRIKPL